MALLRRLALPATETQITLALVLSLVVMALLLCALLYESSVIEYQRNLIRWLWEAKAASGSAG
jgi:hypothetical protein